MIVAWKEDNKFDLNGSGSTEPRIVVYRIHFALKKIIKLSVKEQKKKRIKIFFVKKKKTVKKVMS